MTDEADAVSELRSGLIEALRMCRAIEREIFGALEPNDRDTTGPDGAWSAKDNLAHLSAWRHRQATKMAAIRAGDPEPGLPGTTIDETNAVFHAERAGWTWDRVEADADATAEAFIAEIAAASDDALGDQTVLGPIMGDGPEHDLGHLPAFAAGVGMSDRVLRLADLTQAMLDRGEWPARSAAFARYNLACFHALGGRLDTARALLRLALPEDEGLRTLAPTDDDLLALRTEIPSLIGE